MIHGVETNVMRRRRRGGCDRRNRLPFKRAVVGACRAIVPTFLLLFPPSSVFFLLSTSPSFFASAEKSNPPPLSPYLDENSVVLITGAAGFLGSELAMALHRTYSVKKLLCVDSMDSGFGVSSLVPSSASARNEAEWKDRTAYADDMKSRTEEELALFEFKRQRVFHMLQAVGSKARFYRADVRPSIPEYFDLGEVPLLDTLFKTHPDITHVVHLADPYHSATFDHTDRGRALTQAVPRVKEQTKAGMMESMLEQLKKVRDETGRSVQFVYASSYEAYDHLNRPNDDRPRPNPVPFREDLPITVPSSLHGASKLIDEILADSYSRMHGIYSVGLRFFPVYGPWGLPGTALFEMAERAVSDSKSSLLFPGTDPDVEREDDTRDWVYIDDAVDAIMTAMQFRPPPPDEDEDEDEEEPNPVVINVGTGKSASYREVAEMVGRHFPRDGGVPLVESDDDDDDAGGGDAAAAAARKKTTPTTSYASTERAEALLGFEPRVSLREGLVRLLAWHYDRAYPYGGRPEREKAAAAAAASNVESNRAEANEERNEGEEQRWGEAYVSAEGGIEGCNPFDDECLNGAPVFPCASECGHDSQCAPSFYDGAVTYAVRKITEGCDAVLYTTELSDHADGLRSASMAVSPDSVPHAEGKDGKGRRCNVAFVSEGSPLVRRLKKESGYGPHVAVAEEYNKALASGKSVDDARLLRHGFWTLVPVSVPIQLTGDEHVLRMLPKLSPGNFFGPTVRHAIYADPHVLIRSVPDLLVEANMQPYKEGKEGQTAMLAMEPRPAGDDDPRRTQEGGTRPTHRGKDTIPAEALQERTYDTIRVGLRGEMPGGGVSPIADTSLLVHALSVEDARLFRCDAYGEVVQWDVGRDERALEFVMGLHDLWSRVVVQWAGEEPWWKGEDVVVKPAAEAGSSSTAAKAEEGGGRGPAKKKKGKTKRRRLSNAVDWAVSEKSRRGRSAGDDEDEHPRRRKLKENDEKDDGRAAAADGGKDEDGKGDDEEPNEEAGTMTRESQKRNEDGTWMGVLSSGDVHYFARIVPPSKAGVVYLDEYAY